MLQFSNVVYYFSKTKKKNKENEKNDLRLFNRLIWEWKVTFVTIKNIVNKLIYSRDK